MMGVPPIYLFMAQQPGFADADLSSLERAVVGGAPMPEALLETWAARGTAIVQGYGLTEAAPNVLCLPPEDAVRKLGFAGKPYPFVDVRLSAEDELQVRGPNVFPGYWRNPEATAAAFTDDGWLRTGDVAECDDEGFYRIKGRLKDMYISGGENVYPAEVEAVLHEHPQRRGRGGRRRPARALGRGRRRVRRRRRRRRGRADRVVPRRGSRASRCRSRSASSARSRATASARSRSRSLATEVASMTDVVTGADGRTLSARGVETRQRLLDAAEQVFGELGYHDASIVKITEAAGVGQGTFYLYFASKKEIFDELVRDLNRRIRHAMKRGVVAGDDAPRGGAARLRRVLPLHRRAPRRSTASSARRSSSRPRCFQLPLRQASPSGTSRRSARPSPAASSATIDPEVTAWALMAAGEMIGLRWILWGDGEVPGARRRGARAHHPRVLEPRSDARLARRDGGVSARARG